MKKLHKKIGAMALAGMIVAGGCIAGGGKVFADEIYLGPKDEQRYREEKYDKNIPNHLKYQKSHKLLNREDEEIEGKIEEIASEQHFFAIKLSSQNDGINNYVRPLRKVLDGIAGADKLLEKPQAYFESVKDFEKYMKEQGKNIQKGMYRVQVAGFDGIFKKV